MNKTVFDKKIVDMSSVGIERLKNIWKTTLYKCSSENHKSYKYYGGKGITVCDEWLTLSNFVNWAKQNGYNDNLTLDRINSNDNYYPKNCRWVTWKKQGNNRSNNIYITINNETKTITEWSDISNISTREINKRLKLKVPEIYLLDKNFDSKKYKKMINNSDTIIEYNGEKFTIQELSIKLNIKETTLYHRLYKGLSSDEMTKQPIGGQNPTLFATINGETKSLMEWSIIKDIKYITLLKRYNKGIRDNELLNFKKRNR